MGTVVLLGAFFFGGFAFTCFAAALFFDGIEDLSRWL